jgi:hypothetical protein
MQFKSFHAIHAVRAICLAVRAVHAESCSSHDYVTVPRIRDKSSSTVPNIDLVHV